MQQRNFHYGLAVMIAVSTPGCKRHAATQEGQPAQTSNSLAKTLEIVGVSESETPEHEHVIRDTNGATWYRTRFAPVNWSDLDRTKMFVEKDWDGNGYVIRLVLTDRAGDALCGWTGAHKGQKMAICVDGTAYFVETIKVAIRTVFLFPGFETEEDATRMAAYLRDPLAARPPG